MFADIMKRFVLGLNLIVRICQNKWLIPLIFGKYLMVKPNPKEVFTVFHHFNSSNTVYLNYSVVDISISGKI